MAETNIKFRIILESQHDEVMDFLKRTFFRDEPMNKCVDILTRQPQVFEMINKWIKHRMSQNLSLVATDAKTGEIIGVCINQITSKSSLEVAFAEKCSDCKGTLIVPIVNIIHDVNHKCPEIYDQLESQDLFDLHLLSIDQTRREKGLGRDLLRRSLDIAKALGFTGVKTEATGDYSRKALERLGLEVKAEVDYATYKPPGTDTLPFASIESPHTSICVMTKKIE